MARPVGADLTRRGTLRSWWISTELRNARRAANLTVAEVTRRTGISRAALTRAENGETVPHQRNLRDLLDLYGVKGAQKALLLDLAAQPEAHGWWQAYTDLPGDYPTYLAFEAQARTILDYETSYIPGLLQTEAYARAVIRGTSPFDDDDTVEARVTDRMERQSVLRGENAPTLLAIVEESLLRRPIGGPEVMREQLRHLADTAERPGVTVQVIPRTVGAYPGMEGPVVLLSFEATTDVAYLDHARGGELVNRPQDVVAVAAQFDALRAEALPRGASLDLIRKAAEEWT